MLPYAALTPLPVVVPLAVGALLLVSSNFLPRFVPDAITLVTALLALFICLGLARASHPVPIVYWFGNWTPANGFPIGIAFYVEPAAATMGAAIALLFAASLVFAWGYYDEVHAHFHVLMLSFMAGMIGFCFAHDLFNLFVWFEVMSVAGFALTGYELRTDALEGALNFTITNAIAGYLFLAGIGLIYARAGVLDFSALQLAVARAPHDAVIEAAFALLICALLVKAAQVPFHLWLSDAHAVAPSPVSVIFSGAMVALGVYGVSRLIWAVFSPSLDVQRLIHTVLVALGCVSTLSGGLMSFW